MNANEKRTAHNPASGAEPYMAVPMAQKESASVRFLYCTRTGRCLLFLLVRPVFSRLLGFIMDRRVSALFIKRFIKNNRIAMERYRNRAYRSFNDFFTRELAAPFYADKQGPRDVFSPCDGRLSAYVIDHDSVFFIKSMPYTIHTLLDADGGAYAGGTCLIFRLTPSDYHRYCYIDSGRIKKHVHIPGVLHTVRPIALGRYPVFAQNTREYVVVETENLGEFIQMEVGALFVGKIKNHKQSGDFSRGEEKGMFLFGGSTIVLLFPKDAICIDPQILMNTANDLETPVRMGDVVAHRNGFSGREETN